MARVYVVEFTDGQTGATSPIDRIEVEDGYTAEQYVEECRRNADEEWREMLEQGSVELVEEEQ